jgi:hypothetical protein
MPRTPRDSRQQDLYANDKLAGLIFLAGDRWCYFRTDRRFEFNWPLDLQRAYALIDPETEQCIGIRSSTEFTGFDVPASYRVFLLRPLVRDM